MKLALYKNECPTMKTKKPIYILYTKVKIFTNVLIKDHVGLQSKTDTVNHDVII